MASSPKPACLSLSTSLAIFGPVGAIVERGAVAGEGLGRHVPDAGADELAVQAEADVDARASVVVFARPGWADAHVGGDVSLVGQLVFGKARVALDAEVVRLGIADLREGRLQALLELGDEELERAAAQAHEVVLVGLEPGAALLGLELEEELNCLVGEALKTLERRRGGHGGAKCSPIWRLTR